MSGKIVFLLSHARHARMWRRVKRVARTFTTCEVLAFERPVATPAIHGAYRSMGTIANGRYLARLGALFRALRAIRTASRDASVVYCFSLDLLALGWLASRLAPSTPRLAYEIADIREILAGTGPVSRLLRLVERLLIRRCAVVVLTSSHYHDGYFREIQQFTDFPHVVIEHKPELPPLTRDLVRPRALLDPPLVIGYFGILKSPASFDLLCRLARDGAGAIRVVCRGIFVPPLDADTCLARIESTPHMQYGGPYKSPDDLASIYQGVDLIWDAYNETANARWQRTTRFSEALFFRRPLIVNPATQDGRLATAFDVGLPIDLADEAGAVAAILQLDGTKYARWLANLDRVPDSLVLYGNEYAQLHQVLAGEEDTAGGMGVRKCPT